MEIPQTKTIFLFISMYCGMFFHHLSASSRNQTANNVYQWETGRWGSCTSPFGCGEGKRERKISCIRLDGGLVMPDSNCMASRKPTSSEPCFYVCEKLKPYLRWSVGPWSSCTPRKLQASTCSSPGTATRLVQCLHQRINGSASAVTDAACEHFWSKPDDVMSCSYECPQDCIVSEGTCSENSSSSCFSAVQSDTYIVVAPEDGGLECPAANVSFCTDSSCISEETEIKQYVLKVSDWGPCLSDSTPASGNFSELSLKPEIGLTTRRMTCLESHGEAANFSSCSNTDSVVLRQRCLVPTDCELTPWSEWRVVEEGCMNSLNQVRPEKRIRTRNLVRPPLGNGRPCGPLYEERTVKTDLPRCTKYKWYPLEWGECVVYRHTTSGHVEVIKPTCGGGVRTRNITCLRTSDLVPVEESFCAEPRPPTIERCEVLCIRDCKVSHWSKWGPCLPLDTVTDFTKQILTGYRKRSRSVVVSSSSGGSPCPHLEEVDSCTDVLVASWLYGNWSDCQLLDPSSHCGPGEKTRDYSCVTFKGNPISEFFCEQHASYRETTEACRIPCPNDCTLSEWSDWTTCSKTCSDDESEGRSHRNRTVLAIKGPGGTSCHEDKKETNACNRQSCTLVSWWTSPWSECNVQEENESIETCGEGLQTRKIYCRKGDYLHLDFHECRNMQKPESTRKCYKPCPEDCVLTKWTEWSPCPSSCQSGATQRRFRFIDRNAKHGGKSCPEPLTEVRSCPMENDVLCSLPSNVRYRWYTGQWSSCTLPGVNDNCGTGFQTRTISCVDETEYPVEMHHCVNYNESSEVDPVTVITAVPAAFRLCQITCHNGQSSCVHSAWTPWSSCPHKYKAKRIRTRELVGPSANDPFCKERFSLMEEEQCPFLADLQSLLQTPWSSCILEDSNRTITAINGNTVGHHCGTGYRYKSGLQVKGVDSLEPGFEKDLCLVDCPMDCSLSQWTEWTDCDVPCGHGYRERQRTVLVPGNDLGRPCPSSVINGTEIQRDVCIQPCADFRWITGGWSNCELTATDSVHKKCGNGTQHRIIKCVEKRTEKEVEASRCDPLLKPKKLTTCRIACPGECVVSEWVTWKHCTEPCRPEHSEERRRVVLRRPSSHYHCPKLFSKEPCVLNNNCHEHSWHFGNWGSCLLPEGASCGEGVQKRALICKRSDGRQVDAIKCKKIEDSPSLNHLLSKPCYQDCPIDCVMSTWTKWTKTQCTQHCGNDGVMIRQRFVLQAPSEGGQQCPEEQEQRKPCPFRPCYHWESSDWSECDLGGASCGFGVRRRLVRCLRYDGLQVDKAHCLASNLTFIPRRWLDPKWLTVAHGKMEKEECYVRCPGDCILSEWTSWGPCHKDCSVGQKIGYRTSSRILLMRSTSLQAECPAQMWRTRPCWDNECPTFNWKFRNDSLICERSDGLIVKGGCTNAPRPCFPGCESLPNGKCDSRSGVCYCKLRSGRWILVTSENAGKRKCDYPPPKIVNNGPKRPANHTAPTFEIHLKYYPDDSQVSFWMYAMISIGSAFVIFVVVTIYLMCRSSIRRRMVSVQRQGSVRRRCLASPERHAEPNSYS